MAVATADLPQALGPRLPARARDARRGHGDARRGHRRHARRSRRSRASARRSENFRARQRAPTATPNHADRRPERPLLPVRRPPLVGSRRAIVLGYGGYLVFDGADDDRRPVRVPRLPDELLRPGAAALAALQHLPLRGRRARQDHGRARRGARGARRAEARRARADRAAASRFDDVRFALRHAGPRCCTGSTSTCRPGRRSRSSATPAPASRRSPSCSRASTTRPPGAITIDGVDLRDVYAGVAAPPARDRAAGGLPVRRHRRARTSPSAGPDATASEIVAAARAVGADEFIERLEDGYETQLGERGSRLSLGQRQLVAFARALLADPRILILDEATSSVDIGTERKIERALRRLLAGRTAFVIAHRLSTIRDADLIVVLEHGQVVEQGTHDELLARRGLYTSLYGDWAADAA